MRRARLGTSSVALSREFQSVLRGSVYKRLVKSISVFHLSAPWCASLPCLLPEYAGCLNRLLNAGI
jgi:hypothetical protein